MHQILVVVANPFQSNGKIMKAILSLLSDGRSVSFPLLSKVTIKGSDTEQFLQGQLTQNIKSNLITPFYFKPPRFKGKN